MRSTFKWAAVVVALVVIGVTLGLVINDVRDGASRIAELEGQRDDAEDTAADNAAVATEAKEGVEALEAQVRRLGGKPVVDPDDLPDPDGTPVQDGDRTDAEIMALARSVVNSYPLATRAEVQQLVADWYRDHPPRDGETPSTAEIRDLVEQEFAANPPEPGEPGTPGQPGDKGDPGRGVSDAVIRDDGHLVLSYSDGTTQDLGDVVGADGKDGTDGQPGRGVTALSCDSLTPMTLTVTYSDGTTETYECNSGGPP